MSPLKIPKTRIIFHLRQKIILTKNSSLKAPKVLNMPLKLDIFNIQLRFAKIVKKSFWPCFTVKFTHLK